MTIPLTLYIASLVCLTSATFLAIDTIAAGGASSYLPYFVVIGAGLLLLLGVLGLLWRMNT